MAIRILSTGLYLKPSRRGVTTMATKTCQICKKEMSHRYVNRHMVKYHGWRYIDKEQPNTAVPLPKWWRFRDLQGHFLPNEPKEKAKE